MADCSEAAAALLMLSTGFFRKLSTTPQIYRDSDDDDERMELAHDLTMTSKSIIRKPCVKRLLSPMQCDNKRQRRTSQNRPFGCQALGLLDMEKFTSIPSTRIVSTPTSSINRLLPAANFFRPITSKQTFYDENYEHNYAALSGRQQSMVETLQETAFPLSPSCSEMSEMEDTSFHLANPIIESWTESSPTAGLVDEVRVEFERLQRDSKFAKGEYVKNQIAASPIEFNYNPNKSHMRKGYLSNSEEETRMKNNLASRRSRYKKKLTIQIKNTNLDFDRLENRQLYAQEQWLSDHIDKLEEKVLTLGFDLGELKALRARCGV